MLYEVITQNTEEEKGEPGSQSDHGGPFVVLFGMDAFAAHRLPCRTLSVSRRQPGLTRAQSDKYPASRKQSDGDPFFQKTSDGDTSMRGPANWRGVIIFPAANRCGAGGRPADGVCCCITSYNVCYTKLLRSLHF